jgi:hypothetical protein
MHEALCRSSGTTLDSVHAEDGPPITQRTSGLSFDRRSRFRQMVVSIHKMQFNFRYDDPSKVPQ